MVPPTHSKTAKRPMHSKHSTKSQMQELQMRPGTDRSHPSRGAPKNAKIARPKNANGQKATNAKNCRPPSSTFCDKDIYKEETVGIHTEPAHF